MQTTIESTMNSTQAQITEFPLVSVLMPAYNHERFVEQAVRSVWYQTYKNIELIVIDDGSSDQTLVILRELCSISPIPMKIFTQENQGICRTLNRCIEISHGEWLAFLASDDKYQPNFIGRMLAETKKHPSNETVFHCDAVGIDEQGIMGMRLSKIRKIPPHSGDSFCTIVNDKGFIISSTIFLSRSLIKKVGVFDVKLRAEDFDMHLRLARIAKFVFIDESLFFARKVRGSLGSRRRVWSDDIFVALEKHKDFIGNDYQKIITNKHKKLAIDCYSDFDLQGAAYHFSHGINSVTGEFKSITLLGILIGFIRETPRALAVYLLPDFAIRYIRAIKHLVIVVWRWVF